MNSKQIIYFLLACFTLLITKSAFALPKGFVYLQDAIPTIKQDMRYVGDHNFIGRPLKGYKAGQCILTREAAEALAYAQTELAQSGLSLKVYDCYRPKMAVDDIMQWSKQEKLQMMKAEFYPNINKADFFKLGYVVEKSGHCRGSTVDLTIVPIATPAQPEYHSGDKLVACFASYQKRYRDNSIDMGTGFDCMDPASHPTSQSINSTAYQHRMLLRSVMIRHGFAPIEEEWWHFTLKQEPYPTTYFNFPVVSKT